MSPTQASHLSHVEGCVKCGVEAGLGPRTLVVGPNGSGKTSIVYAAELLLTGRCGLGAKPSSLAALATTGQKALSVRGKLGDSTLSFRVPPAGKPLWTRDGAVVARAPGACLSMDLSDLLLHSDPAQTLRPALLRVACAGLDVDALAGTVVPDALREAWAVHWHRARASVNSDADALAELARELRAQVREQKKPAALPEPIEAPEEAQIESLRSKLGAARSAVAAAEMLASARALDDEIAVLRAQLDSLGQHQSDEQVMEVLTAAVKIARYLTVQESAPLACPVCEREVDHAASDGLLARASDRLARGRGLFDAAVERRRIATKMAQLQDARNLLPKVGAAIEQSLEDPAALETELVELLQRRERARAYVEARVQAAKAASGTEAAALLAATDRLVVEALDQHVVSFEQRINHYLSTGRVRFILFESARPVCRITWRGLPIAALSGAQQADVIHAFACAWAERSDAEVKLVVVDEVGLDLDTVRAMTATALDGDFQLLLCAAMREEDAEVVGHPQGWTTIRCRRTK